MQKGVLFLLFLMLSFTWARTLPETIDATAALLHQKTKQIVEDAWRELIWSEPGDRAELEPALRRLADAATEARAVSGGFRVAANAMLSNISAENLPEVGFGVFAEYVQSKLPAE